MNKTLRAILLASLLCTPALSTAQSITLIANTWSPYVDQNLPQQGMALELVEHVYRRAGYEPSVSIESWPRAMEGVKVGLFDVLAATWYVESREEDFVYSKPYLVNSLKMIKLTSLQGDYFEMSHLEGKRVGVLQDYAYGVDFANVPGLTLVTENHLIQNLLNLLNDKVDFVIGDERSLAMQLSSYLNRERGKFSYVDIDLPSRSLYIAASRDTKAGKKLVTDFNAALLETLNDGSYKAIIDKWNQRYGLALEEFPATP